MIDPRDVLLGGFMICTTSTMQSISTEIIRRPSNIGMACFLILEKRSLQSERPGPRNNALPMIENDEREYSPRDQQARCHLDSQAIGLTL